MQLLHLAEALWAKPFESSFTST